MEERKKITIKVGDVEKEIKDRKETLDRQFLLLKRTMAGINLGLAKDEIPLKLIITKYKGENDFLHLTESDKARINISINNINNDDMYEHMYKSF